MRVAFTGFLPAIIARNTFSCTRSCFTFNAFLAMGGLIN